MYNATNVETAIERMFMRFKLACDDVRQGYNAVSSVHPLSCTNTRQLSSYGLSRVFTEIPTRVVQRSRGGCVSVAG